MSNSTPFYETVGDQLGSQVFSFYLASATTDSRQKSTIAAGEWYSSYIAAQEGGQEGYHVEATSDFPSKDRRQLGSSPQPTGQAGAGPTTGLPEQPPIVNAPGGHLLIGGIDSAVLDGDPVYQPVTRAAYWQTNIQGYQANGKSLPGAGGQAIFDTGELQPLILTYAHTIAGTSLIYLNAAVAIPLMQAIGATPAVVSGAASDSGYYGM